MSMTLPRRVAPADTTIFQDLETESIMLDLHSEYYFSLDDIGTRMWQLLSEHRETAVVVAHLLEEYDVDEATLHQDLAALIEQLTGAGLLVVSE